MRKPSPLVAAAAAVVLATPSRRNKWSVSAQVPYHLLDELAEELRREGWNIDAIREASDAVAAAQRKANRPPARASGG